MFLQVLNDVGYKCIKEFVLNPIDTVGIPNSRNRYYLVACMDSNIFGGLENQSITAVPLSNYLRMTDHEDSSLLVPASVTCKYGKIFDLVYQEDNHSCCFTKNYGRFYQGTGSIVCLPPLNKESGLHELFMKHDSGQEPCDGNSCILKELKLRFFSPKEIKGLMGFPEWYSFPPSTSRKQQYQLLGNSVNVKVVQQILSLLSSSLE